VRLIDKNACPMITILHVTLVTYVQAVWTRYIRLISDIQYEFLLIVRRPKPLFLQFAFGSEMETSYLHSQPLERFTAPKLLFLCIGYIDSIYMNVLLVDRNSLNLHIPHILASAIRWFLFWLDRFDQNTRHVSLVRHRVVMLQFFFIGFASIPQAPWPRLRVDPDPKPHPRRQALHNPLH
jgi:hypothetical protein